MGGFDTVQNPNPSSLSTPQGLQVEIICGSPLRETGQPRAGTDFGGYAARQGHREKLCTHLWVIYALLCCVPPQR